MAKRRDVGVHNRRSIAQAENCERITAIVGMNARTHRLRLGMTQKECAQLLTGAHESYWRQLENGNKTMSVLRLVEVADVLGVKAAELLEGV